MGSIPITRSSNRHDLNGSCRFCYFGALTLETDVADGVQTEGSAEKLTQVITILLDNALKYDDPSFPVRFTLQHPSNQSLLCVAGRGEPLSKADCRNIFKRFYRVDQARNDTHSYGLGLSIAESIVAEHGGSIWAEHRGDENCFFVSLPDHGRLFPVKG